MAQKSSTTYDASGRLSIADALSIALQVAEEAAVDGVPAGEKDPLYDQACEIVLRTRAGDYRWILWSGVAAPGQGLLYISGKDVTSRTETIGLWKRAIAADPNDMRSWVALGDA